jgi:DNA-binding MarR family transcriptional regulator
VSNFSPTIDPGAGIPVALAGDVGFLLARCSATGVRATNVALASVGLRARHYAVLQVAAVPGGSSQRQLGLDLGLDPSAVVSLVDDLQKAGLVARTPDPADRRARVISATDRGMAVLRKAAPLVAEAVSEVTGPLDENEVEVLRGLLQRIVAAAADG